MRGRSLSRIPIAIVIEGIGEARGELVRFWAPRTVEAIARRLPLEGRAKLWDGEVYFPVPIAVGTEKAVSEVELGTIAYWPMGQSICIFYARTKPYSPVNRIGTVKEGLNLFERVTSGTRIRLEKV